MIAFTLYFILICFLIYKTDFFGILKDTTLNSRFYSIAFVVKCLGIAFFTFIYSYLYGSANYLDSGNFFSDSRILFNVSGWDFSEFMKELFGLADESPGTDLYENFIQHTTVWDKNPDEFLYNDNRLLIRLHALLHFISFHNYFVHALFSCLFSLIGIQWIYKSFKFLFPGKEFILFLCWLFFPGLWFWTSGLFKEGPALFLMGMLLVSMKRMIIDRNFKIKNILMLLAGITFSFLVKPYLMIPVLICSVVFFIIYNMKAKKKIIIYFTGIMIFILSGNFILKSGFNQDILSLMAKRQNTFVDMSGGGIFLVSDYDYVRLPFKYDLIDTSQGKNNVIIKEGTRFMCWEHSHQKDTMYGIAGTPDSFKSKYKFQYAITPANSTLSKKGMESSFISFIKSVPYAFYYTIFKPLFFDARNTQDLLASLENLIIIAALLFLFYYCYKKKSLSFELIYFLSLGLTELLIIGTTSPNIGAIERYRALAVPFILMASIYQANLPAFEHNKVLILFKRQSFK